MIRIFLVYAGLFIASVVPVLAQTPEQVVENFYAANLKARSEADAVAENRHLFTPGFLRIIDRYQALAKKARAGDNYFTVGNGGWSDYEVKPGYREGGVYVVPVDLYCGLRSETVLTDPVVRKNWPKAKADVLLADVGQGFQIYNLEMLPGRWKGQPPPKKYLIRRQMKANSGMLEAHLRKSGKL